MGSEDPTDPDPEVAADPSTQALVPARRSRALVPADPFRRYLAEARRYPTLTREEEQELGRRYRDTGDRTALFRLVTANLMLVVRIALSYRRAARNLLDLIGEGNIGLLQAVDRFDPEIGVRLPTYAAWWIRAYMVKFLLDNVRLVRVGTTNSRRKLLRHLRREKQRLEEMGYEVGPKLLASHFGVSEEDVVDVQKALRSHDVSLDEPLRGSEAQPGDAVRGDLLGDDARPDPEQIVARGELQQLAEEALAEFRKGLSDRELALLDRRILSEDPLTLQELGDRFGTTREAVRQAEARLMNRLRAFVRDRLGDLGQVRVGPK